LSSSKRIEKIQFKLYLCFDFLSGFAAYAALHMVRKLIVEPEKYGQSVPLKFDAKFWIGACATSLIFIAISGLSGVYRDLARKSRIALVFNTFGGTIITAIVLFFAILLDDIVGSYNQYYYTLGTYSGSLLLFSTVFRLIWSTRIRNLIDRKKLTFPALIIGSGKEAADLLATFTKDRSKGYDFKGYLSLDGNTTDDRIKAIPYLGTSNQLLDLLNDNEIDDVIIAIPSGNSDLIARMVSTIENVNVRIHVLPNVFSIISGQVRMESLGRSLIEVKRELIKPHVAFFKRSFDIVVAALLLVLSSPFVLFSMSMIAIGSKGPIFYTQERLGKHGKTFRIIKLRSMYQDAEAQGPQLSSEEDPRITPWGRTMRKFRLDEMPQFYNVLRGDMSIVGPRPERKFYFDQIIAEAPQYRYLLRVKPGITSWGMVKFGYAENVEEMLERARYDLIYTENITILNDIKILFYTLVIVLQGRGK